MHSLISISIRDCRFALQDLLKASQRVVRSGGEQVSDTKKLAFGMTMMALVSCIDGTLDDFEKEMANAVTATTTDS